MDLVEVGGEGVMCYHQSHQVHTHSFSSVKCVVEDEWPHLNVEKAL